MSRSIYRIRRPEVVSELFEGEAVVVNLRLGRYYALSPLASEVWTRLGVSPSLEALVTSARALWPDADEAARELSAFLERLGNEELIEIVPRTDEAQSALEPLPAHEDPTLGFETFTDLEDLLVLDPIHDLDENGWPIGEARSAPDAVEE